MDRAAEPFGEVREVNTTFIVSVLNLQKLLQVLILKRVRAKIVQEVFYRYKAVEIFVQGEKGLPNLSVVACNFSLYFLIQLLDSLRK